MPVDVFVCEAHTLLCRYRATINSLPLLHRQCLMSLPSTHAESCTGGSPCSEDLVIEQMTWRTIIHGHGKPSFIFTPDRFCYVAPAGLYSTYLPTNLEFFRPRNTHPTTPSRTVSQLSCTHLIQVAPKSICMVVTIFRPAIASLRELIAYKFDGRGASKLYATLHVICQIFKARLPKLWSMWLLGLHMSCRSLTCLFLFRFCRGT
jgi:hypothetical protein